MPSAWPVALSIAGVEVQVEVPVRGSVLAAGAPPVLVVGDTGDPDTPYEDSVALASTLRTGRLLTYRGKGHTGFFQSEKCVVEKITTYLADSALPPQDIVCED